MTLRKSSCSVREAQTLTGCFAMPIRSCWCSCSRLTWLLMVAWGRRVRVKVVVRSWCKRSGPTYVTCKAEAQLWPVGTSSAASRALQLTSLS